MPLTWNAVQEVYSPDPVEFLAEAEGLGLQWPVDVFEQLFIDHHNDEEFAELVAFIDWSTMTSANDIDRYAELFQHQRNGDAHANVIRSIPTNDPVAACSSRTWGVGIVAAALHIIR
jgi:hypothetical protein